MKKRIIVFVKMSSFVFFAGIVTFLLFQVLGIYPDDKGFIQAHFYASIKYSVFTGLLFAIGKIEEK